MPRGFQSFKESDVTRAIRAVTKAGQTVYQVNIRAGEISLVLHLSETKDGEPVAPKKKIVL